MLLLRCQLDHWGPLNDVTLQFAVDDVARPLTCVLGSAGTGKTHVLSAVAATRPGHAVVLGRPGATPPGAPPRAAAAWATGDDDPARPHPIRITTPNALSPDETEESAVGRRREQTAFDRRAADGGFAFLALPGCRWFSRSPVVLSAHDRLLGRYDVRAPVAFEDATRNDLARETKQVLTGAAVGAALAPRAEAAAPVVLLDAALRQAVNELVALAGYTYVGPHPETLEPTFRDASGHGWPFDDVPISVRHLAAFAALPLRVLYAAYGPGDPLWRQGVIVIDDLELHHDPATQRGLSGALRRALPRVQWIVTTSSPEVASGCELDEVIALRHRADGSGSGRVEVHTGACAVVH
jgi:hypothetical protein